MTAPTPFREPRCAECGGPLPKAKPHGRPRRFCKEKCGWRYAQRTKRARFKPLPIPVPAPGEAADRRVAESLAALVGGSRPGPPEEQLVVSLLEMEAVAGRMLMLEFRLPRRLGGLSSQLGTTVLREMESTFPGVVARQA